MMTYNVRRVLLRSCGVCELGKNRPIIDVCSITQNFCIEYKSYLG